MHIFTIYASRDVAVCRKFRCILEVLRLQELQKKIWVQFHDLCIQKRRCFLLSADAFWKFSACKFCRKSSWCNFTIYVSKNEAVSCEVQMHFGSFRLMRFMKKFWVHFHDLCVQKQSCFQIQTHFRSFLPACFTENVLGA